MIRQSQNSDARALIQDLRHRMSRYRLALEWLKKNKKECFKCTDGIFFSISHGDAMQYIAKQVKLLENEVEKIRYIVHKGRF